DAAFRRRLAGLFLLGLDTSGIVPGPEARALLQRGARREIGDDARLAGELDDVLRRLAPFRPVPLKGRALALAVWPQPAMRPAGDTDLPVEAAALPEAAAALAAAGYRLAAPDPPGWLRPARTGLFCAPPEGRAASVDLHIRLFRSVGGRIDPARLLARARPAT